MTSGAYYDDNFGHWDMRDEDDVAHYRQVQATNVRKKCSGCGTMVSIQPQYAYCNSCADKIEQGRELPGCDDDDDDDDGAYEAREAVQARLRADIGDDELLVGEERNDEGYDCDD